MERMLGTMGCLLLVCVLLLAVPKSGFTAESVSDMLQRKADFFSDISDALRDADNARNQYYQYRSGHDAARYEQEWRDYEYKLEEARVQRMAKEAKVSPSEIQRMREEGISWKDISDRCRIDSSKMGYGHKGPQGYDRDNDHDLHNHIYKKDKHGKARGHHKGTADGPPGQYKKDKKDKKNDKKHKKD